MEIIFNTELNQAKLSFLNGSIIGILSNEYLEVTDRKKIGILEEITVYSEEKVREFIIQEVKSSDFPCCDIEERIGKALKIAGLSDKILLKALDQISSSELKKIQLAIICVQNPKTIVVEFFEKALNKIERNNIKLLFKNLHKKYNKNIIVVTDNMEYLLDLTNKWYIFNEIFEEISLDDIFNNKLEANFVAPKIIEMINYLNEQGIKIGKYIDVKDLLKAIYREV